MVMSMMQHVNKNDQLRLVNHPDQMQEAVLRTIGCKRFKAPFT